MHPFSELSQAPVQGIDLCENGLLRKTVVLAVSCKVTASTGPGMLAIMLTSLTHPEMKSDVDSAVVRVSERKAPPPFTWRMWVLSCKAT